MAITEHKKMRRVLQWAFPGTLQSLDAAWDGQEDLQGYLDTHASWSGTPVTASEILAKETDYDTFKAALNAPTVDDVAAERDRRLAAGFDYDFGDDRGVHTIGTTEQDMKAWDREVTPYANALVNTNDTTTTIDIVTETGPCAITGAEWQSILIAAAEFRQPIWTKYFAIKAQSPIPADYTDDSHWTAV